MCAVLVDLTPPETGDVIDGLRPNFDDVRFSVHQATVSAQWRDFRDPESGVVSYEVQVHRAAYVLDYWLVTSRMVMWWEWWW